uniref:Uncharacterized protein n=1 Tax=Rhizophora mucronata TaxID=61149 RepID=A0A2P2R389_RHIMU
MGIKFVSFDPLFY